MKLRVSLLACFLLLLPLFQVNSINVTAQGSEAPSVVRMPSYVGISRNYDNRKCAVTISLDDFGSNNSAWQNCLYMLTRKGLYHTIGIITNTADWNFAQYWVNQGYTEAGSHSASHFDLLNPATSTGGRINYEWQVNGSKQAIISHLALPKWWRNGQKQYVYAWIDPCGRTNGAVQQWLGICHYLVERGAATYPAPDPANWDSANNVFEQTGITGEIGPQFGGTTSVPALISIFNNSYNDGKVYHLMAHPATANWSKGGYADQFTDCISKRRDVWYVPLGLLGLYRLVSTRNVTHVTRIEGKPFYTFKIRIDHEIHEQYGASYPMTYVFRIPANWTSGHVYYSHTEQGSWKPMMSQKSGNSFNGIEAARFDFTKHEAYVSVAFRPISDSVYVRICPSTVPRGILSES